MVEMNGINYSTLLSNTGLFSNRAGNQDGVTFKGVSGKEAKKADDGRQVGADRDTYEHGSQAREVKAGYEKPAYVEPQEEQYKALDSDGIQEGVELSDAAKELLAELREKYGNMEISVAVWSSDEEQDYYASLTDKEYSVLINPELLEEMAADESVREQYESILDNAGTTMDTITEELGEDADKIKSVSITIDADGNVSYAVQLLKDMAEQAKNSKKTSSADEQKERIEKRREEKKEQEERRKELASERIEAGSIDELIAAIKERLYPSDSQEKIVIKEDDMAEDGSEAAEEAGANVEAE